MSGALAKFLAKHGDKIKGGLVGAGAGTVAGLEGGFRAGQKYVYSKPTTRNISAEEYKNMDKEEQEALKLLMGKKRMKEGLKG